MLDQSTSPGRLVAVGNFGLKAIAADDQDVAKRVLDLAGAFQAEGISLIRR